MQTHLPSVVTVAAVHTGSHQMLYCFCTRYEVKAVERTTSYQPPATTLRALDPRKAAGPDGVTAMVLKKCAEQLFEVFTRIFNTSESIIPPCLKSAAVIPLLRKTFISGLNDYPPVTLTPVMMKWIERLIERQHMKSQPSTHFQPIPVCVQSE